MRSGGGGLSPSPARGEQCLDLFRGKRFGKEVALAIFAAKRPQNNEVLGGLDTFGDHLPSQLMSQRNNGFHDGERVVVRAQATDERLIYLEKSTASRKEGGIGRPYPSARTSKRGNCMGAAMSPSSSRPNVSSRFLRSPEDSSPSLGRPTNVSFQSMTQTML